MSLALARKELRGLRPFVALAVLFIGVDIVDTMLEQADQNPLVLGKGAFGDESLMIQLVLSFAIGTGLLVREQDEGTLTFLDGLPLTRAQLFLTKLWTSLSVQMLYPTWMVLISMGLHLLSRDSLNRPLLPSLLLTTWGAHALAAAFGLTLGAMLGYLRTLAWAFAAMLATLLAIGGRSYPRLLMGDPTQLMRTPFVGDHWPLPLGSIGVQLALTAFFGFVAWRGFAGSGGSGRLTRLADAMKRPVISVLAIGFSLATIGGFIWAYQTPESQKPKPTKNAQIAGADFGVQPLATIGTKHYTFTYQGNSTNVLALSKRADAIFTDLSLYLPTPEGSPIDVDLSGSMSNTAGTAFWNRIRMGNVTPALVPTLAHETVHVLARRMLTDNGLTELSNMSLFDEGLAQLLEYRYTGNPATQQEDELIAALVLQRKEIRIEQLFDFDAFSRVQDRTLVYPLGAAFTQALISRHGEIAPAKLLQTLGKKDFPTNLRGHTLYQGLFQTAGFDLALVIDDFWKQLAVFEKKHRAELATLPRLRGSIEAGRTALDVHVMADKPLPDDWEVMVRFRVRDDSPLQDFETVYVTDDRARRQRGVLLNDTVCFQPGLSNGNRSVFEAWQCVAVEWAGDDSELWPAANNTSE